VPLLADRARLVAYDRAGFGRSGRVREQLGIGDMAADLVALTETLVPEPAPLVLVGHSMGGLVTRRAAERLGSRLGGLLLLDPTPETAPVYDRFDQTARWVTLSLSVGQLLIWFRPIAWLSTGNVRRVFPPDTYKTMLAEDFTPSGIAQTKKEFKAVATAVHQFRAEPPRPPACPTVVLSASRPLRRGENRSLIAEHQRRYVRTLPDGRFEEADSSHFIQAEQPAIVADRIRHLLSRAGAHVPADGPVPVRGGPAPLAAPPEQAGLAAQTPGPGTVPYCRPPNCQLCTSTSAYRRGVRMARAVSGSGARISAAVPSQAVPSSDSSGP
jgi:pimeloyl-ACP methyl ester carboxylesterase